ncbi:MAG: PAS domain S-box protein [Holophagaceae bacterium]|nr:PAS domain S-box protein [Holophagaceae bacterium]
MDPRAPQHPVVPPGPAWSGPSKRLLLALLFLLLSLGPALAAPPPPAAPIALQLKWRHQFQFAGYYAAARLGYFTAEGLEVTLVEGGPGRDPVQEVVAGRAAYGIGDSDLLVARAKGLPVVAVASIFQHSPYVLMTRRGDGLKEPSDLIGKRVMVAEGQGEIHARAMFLREGVDPARVVFLRHSWNPGDLANGQTDAMSGYSSVEPFLIERLGTPVSLMRPAEHGIDFYGDCLFTTTEEAEAHPDRVEGVRRAVLKGWTYALRNPGEVTGWILDLPGVEARGLSRAQLEAEAAAMKPLILSDIVPLGHMNAGRWEEILRTYKDLRILGPQADLDGFLFDADHHLPERTRKQLLRWGGILGAGLLLFLAWTFTLRRKVQWSARALQESEARFKQLVETSPAPIFIEFQGRFEFLNPAAVALFGHRDAQELLGHPVLDIVLPEDRARIQARVEAFNETPTPLERTELRIAQPDGTVVELEVTTTPIPWKGTTAGRVFLRDITASNAAWKAREASEENFRQLVENSQDCIFVSTQGQFQYMNAAGRRLFQLEAVEQVIGLPMMDFIHPEDRPLMLERSRIFHETGEPAPPQEMRVLGHRGRVALVEVTTSRIEFHGVVAARVFMRDVSAQRTAEAALMSSQGILQGFFDGAPFQMGVTEFTEDQDVLLLSLNPSAAAAMGLSVESAVGVRISDLGLPGPHRGVWVEQYQEALRTRRPVHFDARMTLAGIEHDWAITLAWIGEGPGRPRFAYVVQDVSAQRRMARELEEREATLRAFYDGAPMLMGVTEVTPDGEMIAVSVNEALARSFGRSAQETAGLNARQAGMGKHLHALWLARYKEAGAAGRPIHFVLDSSGMGLKGWLSVTIAPIGPGASGNPRYSMIGEDISEGVRDREALVASESRLEEAQRIAHLGSWVWDQASGTMTWSDELCRIFGVDPALHVPTMEDAVDRVHPDDRAKARALVGEGLATLKPFSYEFRILRPDGEVRTILDQGEVLLDAQGRATGLAGACLDITEQKRAEQTRAALHLISEAAQSTATLPGLFQRIHEIIGDLLPAKNFFVALYDEASDELTFPYFVDEHDPSPGPMKLGDGTLSGQVIRRGEAILLTRETQAQRTTEERSVVGSESIDWLGVPLKSHAHTFGVLVVQSYKGDVRYTEEDKALLEFVSGQVAAAIERKHADEELRNQNDLYQLVQRATNDLIWVWDLATDRSERSDTMEAMFGYTLDEVAPTIIWWEEHLHPEDRDRVRSGIRAVIREGGSAWSAEYRFLRKDGAYAKVLDRGYVVRDEAGIATRMIGAISDLTLRVRAEEALAANEAKSEFLATMSHEIRTPMIGMLGMVEILSHTRLDAEQQGALGVIQSSAKALLGVIGDILDFSKIEAGHLELEPQAVSLRRILEEEHAIFSGAAAGKGLSLTCDIDPALGAAHFADPVRFRQILANFYNNALKFTPSGSVQLRVEVLETGPETQTLAIRLKDTGIGVSPENQKRLFQPFMQAESSTTRRFGGSGLGLTICLRLAKMMGGGITMDSEEGRGTTMSFVAPFPLAKAADLGNAALAEAWTPMEPPSREAALAAGCLLLLAEDHPTNQIVLLSQLRLAGFQADIAEDGLKGLEAWNRCTYGLVLTDIHMPTMDGYQLAKAIRTAEAAEGRSRIPILALTANALQGELDRCLAVGMDDCIIKPVSIPDLDAKVRQWLPAAAALATPRPGGTGAAASSASSAPAGGLPVDLKILESLSPGDRLGGLMILRDFRDTTREDMASLREAVGAGRRDEIARWAHRIKGAAGMIGAGSLAETAMALETQAGSKDGDLLGPLAAMEAAFAWLNRFATAELEP